MTDNEIIKGLVCCYVINTACDNCAYRKTEDCNETLVIDALDLIKRQQAEITDLKNQLTFRILERRV